MGSGKEKKGLRPNPKRGSKGEVNIGELMSRDPKAERALLSGALKGTPEHPEFLFLAKWGLKPRELLEDPRASDILSRDRKSTRLNSSHLGISYAVFCLKK